MYLLESLKSLLNDLALFKVHALLNSKSCVQTHLLDYNRNSDFKIWLKSCNRRNFL